MYPNLYFFFREVFGVDWQGLKLVNSFGLLVAFAFLAAAWALTSELRRREGRGWLQSGEEEIWVGKGADWTEVLWNMFFGFIAGWKFVGFFLFKEEAYNNPQAFLLSSKGSLQAGVLLALLFGILKWWSGNKTKLARPEKRIIRIWPHDRVGDMIILAAIFGFGGAKIFHNLENWDDLVANPVDALLSFSGLTFYGGLICAGAAIIWYARKHKINLWHLVDSFGPALMLAYAVGRIGCQVAGDGDWGIPNSAYVADSTGKAIRASPGAFDSSVSANLAFYRQAFEGTTTINAVADVPHRSLVAPSFLPDWMVAYTYPHNVLDEGVKLANCEGQWCSYLPSPVFPTPFYETVICLILFAVLWSMRRKFLSPGVLFGWYLVFNGVERFIIEKIRVNTVYDFGFMHPSQAELVSFVLMLLGLAIILLRRNHPAQKAVVAV